MGAYKQLSHRPTHPTATQHLMACLQTLGSLHLRLLGEIVHLGLTKDDVGVRDAALVHIGLGDGEQHLNATSPM
jgi:hypothetical protein